MLRIIIVACGLLMAQMASAGVMAEPFVGLASGSMTGTTTTGGTLTPTEHTTFGLGGRLGYRWGSFWTGLEASYYTGSAKASGSSYTWTDTTMGLLLGYDFPNKYRFFVGYMPSSDIKQKDDSGTEATFKGSAVKVGIGYFFQPRWTFNVELLIHSFSKVASGSAELAISDVYGSLKDTPLAITFGYMF
ncbi:MAG: outer membrane beta-barrel protein [Bdellovibrionales bacterium]|nr:outer membrane beta-barrel protein [Bdellovibrionales bacterium]